MEALREGFARAVVRHPDLFFEKIVIASPDPSRWEPHSVCHAFIKANSGQESQEEWYILKDGGACGRFHGNLAGAHEFKRLAESLYLARREIGDIKYREESGFLECLRRMYHAAFRDGTPLLRLKSRFWGLDWPLPDEKVLGELLEQMEPPIAGRPPYPAHPLVQYFVHDVFTSAIAFVDSMLDPETALSLASGWPPLFMSQSQMWPDRPPISLPKDAGEVKGETTTAPVVESPYAFKFDKRKKRWYLRFPGDKPCDFKDCEGLKLYSRLLRYEQTPMTATQLTLSDEELGKLPKGEKVYSFKQRDDYRRSIDYLNGKIAAAKEAGSTDLIDKLEEKRDGLEEQLKRDLDKYGKPRQLGAADGRPKDPSRGQEGDEVCTRENHRGHNAQPGAVP